MIPRAQKLISVFWPSFIMAGIGTAFFFTTINPAELPGPSWFINLGNFEAYTVGFLLFWALTASSCLLTCYFQKPEDRICHGGLGKATKTSQP